jgi:hypothetical protein
MWIKMANGRLINLDNAVDISYYGNSITFSMVDDTQLSDRYATNEEAQTAYNDLCSLLGITE